MSRSFFDAAFKSLISAIKCRWTVANFHVLYIHYDLFSFSVSWEVFIASDDEAQIRGDVDHYAEAPGSVPNSLSLVR